VRRHTPGARGRVMGGMLALAYAAAHPDSVGPLVLVGRGTFDPKSRARLKATLAKRTSEALQRQLEHLVETFPDPGERLMKEMALTQALYAYAPTAARPDEDVGEPFDMVAHAETWDDMLRLQQAGVYPAAFAAITSPVLMLHGTYDPHPGPMIRASLAPYLHRLEYREWENCGHSPWAERFARDEFFAVLREWLRRQLAKLVRCNRRGCLLTARQRPLMAPSGGVRRRPPASRARMFMLRPRCRISVSR
jgi:pimeloyl-ACP methyl ester carboxylesterase